MFLSDFFFFCQSTATVLILRYCLMNTVVIAGFFFTYLWKNDNVKESMLKINMANYAL